MKSYITAEDIDNNKLTINKQLETIVIDKIKNLLSLKLREYKKRLSLDTEFINKSEDERKQLILAAKNQFKDEIVNSDELKEFKQTQLEILQAKSENYYLIRETMNGLNELNEFSADIERAQLQTYDEQKTFEDLIKLELNYSEKFKTYFNIRKTNIQKYLDLYKNKRLSFHEKDGELYSKLNELYQITKDYDDIDFYDKFGMITNLDVSNQLGDYYLSNLVNHDIKTDNIINNRVSEKKLLNVSGVKNSRNIISNKLLGILLLNHNNASVEARTSFVSTNMVTCYESMYTTTKTNKYTFVTRTLGELILTITDPKYSELSKAERKQIYMTYDGSRPSSDEYYKWNGLQVFDIDLKEWAQVNTHIKQFKKLLFDELSKYHWFLCIAISASGKGLHIYTKVSPAHHVYTELKNNEQISKYWFTVNYCTKVSLLFNVIRKINDSKQNSVKFNQSDFNDNFELRFVDNVVRRITAGIRLTSDLDLFVNENFIDMHPAVNLFESFDFKDIKNLLFRDTTFNQKLIEDINNNLRLTTEQKQEQEDQNILNLENYEFKGDFTNIKPLPRNSINYIVRYNVCNTLAAMFGKDGLQIAHKLLQSDACKNVGEINSFYSCALSNTKQPSKIGLDILHKAGIIKTVKPELKQYTDNLFKNGIKKAIESVSKSTDIEYTLKLKNHEYLGDRDDYLLDDKNGGFTNKKINILLSPPGSGKCLGKDTEILMFNGTKKFVQDIKVGDKLMGLDSTPRTVLSICAGKEELFKIIPTKGKPWICNKSHILSLVETGKWNYKFGENIDNNLIQDINVYNIYNKRLHQRNPREKLFRVPLDFEHKQVSIPPYILGLWLGDGTSTQPEITVAGEDRKIQVPLLKKYAEVKLGGNLVERIDSRNDKVSKYNLSKQLADRHDPFVENNFMFLLKQYNLFGNKHIPKDYLLTDRKTRLMLFAGIIDSDGGGSLGTYDIVTKFPKLADDIEFLCQSLGYYVNRNKKLVKYLNGKLINKEYDRLLISGDFTDLNKYIRLERKKFTRKINKNPLVFGFKIEPIGIGDYYGFEIDGDKRFLLGDFTVTHNTQFLLKLAKQGKRILLVEPFISVIKNKVESDENLMKIFQVFYESHSLNDVDYGVNAITTFDKFSICNYEKISRMFDYICIDESHLLFTSSYRIAATSNAVRKIKDIFYISSNDPFAAKIILMTGTETGDTYFFGDQANIINVYKQSLDKEMKFLICDDMLDSITRLSHEAAKLINNKYRLLIPTNKGEIYSHKLIGMVEHLLGRPIKYGYYKRSNTEQEICRLINQSNTVGDYEIIFCSNYLSVGVDIVDKLKFASIYFGPFSGYEIEQFNARIRRTGIKSIYCIQTESADGTTNDLLLEEPKLSLRLTEEDVENFTDDKQIASAKQEFIAQYDPVLHKITTPGFGYLNGAIRFNKEEYELVMFEQKFLESMIHPIKVAKELIKYGYKITVSDNYEGLSEAEQEELKKIGIESAREEKVRKHNLLVGTYLDLIDNNYHITEEGLEFHGVIDWIGKHKDLIIEDRTMNDFVFIDYNIYGTPVQVFVKSKEAFEKMYSSAKYIIGKYSVTKAKELITRYVDDAGILKQKYFIRAINLMKLIDKADSNELSEPMFNTLEKMYTWMDKFHMNKGYRISYNTYMADVDAWTNSYIDMLNIKISTVYGFQKIKDNILEMLNDLGTKNTSKEGIRFDYNVLPNEDGSLVKYRKSVDTMIETMFNITNDAVSKNKKPREKHITLQKQEF